MPHFLGAVVLQQVQIRTGLMQERTIIDGQQRLTTLQLLLDALTRSCSRRCDSARAADRTARHERRALLHAGPRIGSRCGRPTGTVRRSTPSWGRAASRSRRSRAQRREDGRGAPVLQRAGTGVARAEGPEDSCRSVPRRSKPCARDLLQMVVIDLGGRRERSGDLRDVERARRAAHGRRPDQELRLPAASRDREPTSRTPTRSTGRSSRPASGRPKSAPAGCDTRALDLPESLADRADGRRGRCPGGLHPVQALRGLRSRHADGRAA